MLTADNAGFRPVHKFIRRPIWGAAAAAGVAGLAAGFLAYLGYFGGALFREVPAVGSPQSGFAAVLLSGDMGFKIGMGPKIAAKLAAKGVPVLEVNSMAFGSEARSRADISGLVSKAIQRARARGAGRRLILIGQSFGADLLQVGLADLPPALRREVAAIILVVPGAEVYYRVSLGEYLEIARPDQAALATARSLDWAPLTCIWGVEETTSLCPKLRLANARIVALPGGHPLRHDADALFAAIEAAISRASR